MAMPTRYTYAKSEAVRTSWRTASSAPGGAVARTDRARPVEAGRGVLVAGAEPLRRRDDLQVCGGGWQVPVATHPGAEPVAVEMVVVDVDERDAGGRDICCVDVAGLFDRFDDAPDHRRLPVEFHADHHQLGMAETLGEADRVGEGHRIGDHLEEPAVGADREIDAAHHLLF